MYTHWDLFDVCGACCVFLCLCNPKFFLHPARYMNQKRKRRVGICGFFMIIGGFLVCTVGMLMTIAGSTTIGSLTEKTTGIILLGLGVPCVLCGIPCFLLSFCVVIVVNMFFKKVQKYNVLSSKNNETELDVEESFEGFEKKRGVISNTLRNLRIQPGDFQRLEEIPNDEGNEESVDDDESAEIHQIHINETNEIDEIMDSNEIVETASSGGECKSPVNKFVPQNVYSNSQPPINGDNLPDKSDEENIGRAEKVQSLI